MPLLLAAGTNATEASAIQVEVDVIVWNIVGILLGVLVVAAVCKLARDAMRRQR